MVSPHLRRDLRLLASAFGRASVGSGLEELFEPLLRESSQRATATLAHLCRELHGAATAVSRTGDQLGDGRIILKLGVSPVTNLGIFTATSLKRGQLACFYPGRIFTDDHLPPGDQLFTNEYEGVHLDGKGWFPAAWRPDPALQGREPILWHGNRLAVGNLLNHPAKGQLPNVVPMIFRWPSWDELHETSPAFWARLIPHVVMSAGRLVRTPSGEVGKEATFPPWPHFGMAFFALRGIAEGEELLLNYRLSEPFPGWYVPVDDDALERNCIMES
ncbi:unnamed protein product [Durusdinium trenchii]|uniref:Uncharacterized protein n=2 Tax=Durusdinium trenchii TaxID=1381693 RepID=A0ABP0MZ05_9DINO